MDKNSFPSELRDRAEDESARQDYERLWSLLQEIDGNDDRAARNGREAPDVDSEKASRSFDVDAAWTELASTLDLDAAEREEPAAEEAASPRSSPRSSRPSDRAPDRSRSPRTERGGGGRSRWTAARAAIAAALLVVAGLTGAAVWWTQPVRVTTAAGEQATARLPDGTTVQLNGATSVSYPRGFARFPAWLSWVPGVTPETIHMDERPVTLRGEAYFSVPRGERPFRVQTDNARVDVLGTTFNVRARAHDSEPVTEVVVSEGRVRVVAFSALASSASEETGGQTSHPDRSAREDTIRRSVVLAAPGRSSRLVGSELPTAPQTVDLKYASAWRTGGFAVRNVRLPALLRELEARFGTPLRLQASPPATPLTLHYARSVRLQDVLRDVCVLQGLTYQKTSEGYVLVPADR